MCKQEPDTQLIPDSPNHRHASANAAESEPSKLPPFVLIIDDEEDFGEFQKCLLEERGLNAGVAVSGEEAMKIGPRLSAPGAIALVDMTMPGLDGIETIRKLQERHPVLKFIATSGHAEGRFRARLDDLGVSTFLSKPFTTEKLLRAMQKLLLVDTASQPALA